MQDARASVQDARAAAHPSSVFLCAPEDAKDPLQHAPVLMHFLFYVCGFAITPPKSPFLRWFWKKRVPIWFILVGSLVSGVFLIASRSYLSILVAPLLINYSLTPSTFSVLRGVAPLWLSMYQPDAPTLYKSFRARVDFFLRLFLCLCSLILLIAFGVWAFYLYAFVYLAPAPASFTAIASVAASALFGFYVIFCILGIMITVIVQIVLCIIHELQLELLLRAIRQRTRCFELLSIVPHKFARPSLFERFMILFSSDPVLIEIRPNPAANSPLAELYNRPLSTTFDSAWLPLRAPGALLFFCMQPACAPSLTYNLPPPLSPPRQC